MTGKSEDRYWALILGASSGFGAAVAQRLARDGYNIIGIHLDRQATMPNVERIKESIEREGSKALFFNHNAADANKRKDILEELSAMPEGKPSIKVLLHSLAFGSLRPFISSEGNQGITQAQMEMTLDVMAHSLVYWTQNLVAGGFLVDYARIFCLTSSGSQAVIPGYGAVSAAKAALESHVRQLASELGDRNISVNAIMAGVTNTPALQKIPNAEKMVSVARAKNPMNRLTVPEDIAAVISGLCSDGCHWISGGIIQADGGENSVSFVGQPDPGLK